MKSYLVVALMLTSLNGCGDYDNQKVSNIKLTDQQRRSVHSVYLLNITCAAISRYSNDIDSPIDDSSYLKNAEITKLLLKNDILLRGRELLKKDNLNDDVANANLDKFFNDIRKKIYQAVIDDFNSLYDLNSIYEELGTSEYMKELNGAKVNNCSDVSVVTRRILDPILIL